MEKLYDENGGFCEKCGGYTFTIILKPRMNENLPARRLCMECRFPKGPTTEDLMSVGFSKHVAGLIVADLEADRSIAEDERKLDAYLASLE